MSRVLVFAVGTSIGALLITWGTTDLLALGCLSLSASVLVLTLR